MWKNNSVSFVSKQRERGMLSRNLVNSTVFSFSSVQFLSFSSGEQGWHSGWAFVSHAGLPPMWPGFDSRTRRHMWVEFVVGSRPCSERFFSGYSGFPLSSKTNISKFRFDLESEGHKFISLGLLCATLVKNKVIYLFIYLITSRE